MDIEQARVYAFFYSKVVELGSIERASKLIQIWDGNSWASRLVPSPNENLSTHSAYRIKPETHIVNGHEVPAPYRIRPEAGSIFYYIGNKGEYTNTWSATNCDLRLLNGNNCFKSESDAKENRLAMFKLDKYAEVKS